MYTNNLEKCAFYEAINTMIKYSIHYVLRMHGAACMRFLTNVVIHGSY